jgi:hypothetical protein
MKLRNLLFMLALAALCVVAYLYISSRPKAAENLPAVMPKFEKGDVTAISLVGQGTTRELRRREGTKDGWDVVEGVDLVRADANAVDDLLSAFSRQAVRDRIPKAEAGDGYGLAKPDLVVTLTLGKEPLVMRYGKASLEGSKVYMDTGEGSDVWVVAKDAYELAIAGVASGLRDTKVFDVGEFDVAKLEVVQNGLTTALVTRDLGEIWHIEQPYRGYANPQKFGTELGRILATKLDRWVEFAAPDLVKYGLDKPKTEVRITRKGEGRKPDAWLLGDRTPDGSVHAMEAGTKSVCLLPPRFYEAATANPDSYRDRSFSRLGNADVAKIDVTLKGVHYVLERPASTWEVLIADKPRTPADGDKVTKALDQIIEWQTVEFLDAQKPEDFGVTGDTYIEISIRGSGKDEGAKTMLQIGNPGPDGKTVYARRRGDGNLERVDAGPVATFAAGAGQFFRSDLKRFLPPEAIVEIYRDSGFGAEGEKVEGFKVKRDPKAADKDWSFTSGNTGKPDQSALALMLAALGTMRAQQWIPYDAGKDDFGFKRPKAETCTLTVKRDVIGPEADAELMIGKHRPEGGYYARLNEAGGWAFVIDDAIVDALRAKISKD